MSENTEHQSFQDETKRETSLLIAVSRAIESSAIKHQGTREEATRAILGKLQSSHSLRVADRGWVQAFDHSGNPADFGRLVTDAMLLDKNLGDPESIQAAVAAGTIELGAKSELTTTAQKVAFISRFGEDAWARLPMHRQGTVVPSKEMTKREYLSMSVKDRIEFQKTIEESELGAILSRK